MNSCRRGLALILCAASLVLTAGCATPRPKPKTVGQVVGEGVDASVTWAAEAARSLFKGR